MQEQINEKTVALSIKTAKLTAEVLQKAIRKMLSAKSKKQSTKDLQGKTDPKAPYEAEHGRFQYGDHGR